MNMKSPNRLAIGLVSVALSTVPLVAEDTTKELEASFTDGKPLPALESSQRILKQATYTRGKDTFICRLVTPPASAYEPQVPAPATPAVEETPEQIAAQEALEEQRAARTTSLTPGAGSVVTHPLNVTEIKWTDHEGRSKRVFIHAKLEYLPISLRIELPEWTYQYSLFNFGHGGFGGLKLSQYPADYRNPIAEAASLPQGEYKQVMAEDGTFIPLTEKEAEAIDALIVFYSLNAEQFEIEHKIATEEGRKQAEAKRAYDAKPKTYEIRIWKTPLPQ